MPILHDGVQVDRKCAQVTLDINMLKGHLPLAV